MPGVPPVTATFALATPAGKVTVGGTLATLGLLELRVMVRPVDGAAAERFSTAFAVAAPVMVTLGWAKLTVAVICTARLAAV